MATPVSNLVPVTSNPVVDGLAQGGGWTFSGPRVLTWSVHDTRDVHWLGSMPALQRAFDAWASVANITFTRVIDPVLGADQPAAASTADIAISWSDLSPYGLLGYTFSPDPAGLDAIGIDRTSYPRPEGDIYITTGGGLTAANFQTVLVHEIGHALGLKHSYDDGGNGRPTYANLGLGAHDNRTYTVVSNTGANVTSPMLDDIVAIQAIYGANTTSNAGNDTYTVGGAAYTIWDTGGQDAISTSGSTDALIDLRAGHFSYLGSSFVAIADGVTIEGAIGNGRNDTLLGNEADNFLESRGGRDSLFGDAGNDTLYGSGGGGCTLDGGSGTNTVDYSKGMVFGPVRVSLAGRIVIVAPSPFHAFPPDTLVNIQNAVGTVWDDVLVGDDNANVIQGGRGSGRDTITGGGGNDTLINTGGISLLTYADAPTGVTVNLVTHVATDGLGGTDAVFEFPDVLGSGYGDLLVGDGKWNRLTGGGGNDTLFGGNGDDTLDGGSGYNVADYGGASAGVTVNLATRTTGKAVGTDTLINIQGASGSSFADVLIGSGISDAMFGGGGDDTLTGGRGGDVLTGNLGADRFVFAAGDGHDLIKDYETGAGNDALSFTGAAPGAVAISDLRLQGLLTRSGGSVGLSTVIPGGPAPSQALSWWSQYVPNWTVVTASVDFSGDGAADLLAQDPTSRALYFWSLDFDGNLTQSSAMGWWSQYIPSWNVVAAGDFTGLGRASLLGQSSDGTDTWLFTSTATGQLSASVRLDWWQQYVPNWRILSSEDFNGDGRADILAQDPTSKALYDWSIDGTGQITNSANLAWWAAYLPDWQVAGMADFTGDGRAEIIGQSADRSETWLFSAADSGAQTASIRLDWWAQYLSGWTIGRVADFTGDGRADLIARTVDQSATWLFSMDAQGRLTGSYDLTGLVAAGQTIVGTGNFTGLSTRVAATIGQTTVTVDLLGVDSTSLPAPLAAGGNAQLNGAPLIQAMAAFVPEESQLDGALGPGADDPLAPSSLLAPPH